MKRHALLLFALLLAVAAALSASSVGARSAAPTQVVLWHGYVDYEAKALNAAVATYDKTHPNVHVTAQFYGNADYALQKVLTAIAGGKYPDIAYLYGSWAANIAKSSKTLDLTQRVKDPTFQYNDIWPAARLAGQVNGKVIGCPGTDRQPRARLQQEALQAGGRVAPDRQVDVGRPAARGEEADEPEQEAVRLGLRQRRLRGHRLAVRGAPLAGGRRHSHPDGKKAAFDSPAGVKALTLSADDGRQGQVGLPRLRKRQLRELCSTPATSRCSPPAPGISASFPNVDYGVQILPRDKNHQTIAGPDNWVLFNNGKSAPTPPGTS